MKRYNCRSTGCCGWEFVENKYGDYVKYDDIETLIDAFRELRLAWFNKNLRSYSHERDWEDEEKSEQREKDNEEKLKIYNEQTEKIINGAGYNVAPTCGMELI